ncbi:MAG: S1 family peptidase [Solirubrobacterales bacterium]
MKAWGDLPRHLVAAALACALVALALPAAAAAAEPTAHASIVGGHSVSIANFPSLAYIEAVEDKHDAFACTGTVVAPRVILTAAHCVEDPEKGTMTPAADYEVDTGVTNPELAGPGNVFQVASTHVFPGFDPSIVHGDAAILVLSSPTGAPPIPLAGAADTALYTGGAGVQLAGWGLTNANAKKQPSSLRATSMLVQTPSFCKKQTRAFDSTYSTSAQLCLLAANRASGACFGDSGGPAIGRRADGTPVELGITSTVGPFCTPKVPNVQTRVDFVSTWVSQWIAATESGAPPPPGVGELPAMTKGGAEELAVFALIDAFGKRFAKAGEIAGGCRKASRTRFRCEIAWVTGGTIYAGIVSPFFVKRQGAVAWDSHYRVEWAKLKCIRNQAKNRRCAIHTRHG